ncbi:MAG: hypothetical protein AB7S94_03500, partial [Simkaniaceae bacterium]
MIQQAAELKKYQEKMEAQSLECLPKIDLEDVPKDLLDFELSHEQH